MQKIKTSSLIAEIFNAITHGLGAILSIVTIIFLVRKGIKLKSAEAIIAYSIYGGSMFLLFMSSTLYHSFVFSKYADFFQKIDHSTIYLLIAGTYTPYLLLTIGGLLGNISLAIIWSLAFIGIFFEIITLGKYPKLSILFYLLLGWFVIIIIYPLVKALPIYGLVLLILGGLSYSIGTVFYCFKKIEWLHVVWHIFVVGGAAFMFYSIFYYV
ncbi:MAG: hemolysin III family protein [Fusobacterium sp.]|uniref:PAQR family membrane homeostasis protein TrhA n=1 Tax=Fusobacterium sp. TaxID=68766 RepID=UPI0026DB0CC0|nr:hemolysin III family protein [Fusobacterium sp.]MDO4690411.1 hemolysin III family protein [Fusobacterium sp.]